MPPGLGGISIYILCCLLNEHCNRIFEVCFQCLQEACTNCTIYYTVIATEGKLEEITNNYLVVLYYRCCLYLTYCEDTCIRRIDDGCKFVYIHHAEIGDSECVTRKFLRLYFLSACFIS